VKGQSTSNRSPAVTALQSPVGQATLGASQPSQGPPGKLERTFRVSSCI
jgi:hypothetical protein